MKLLIDILFDLRAAWLKNSFKTSLLGLSVIRFTNSSWLEDLSHFKTIDEFLDKGKQGPEY